MVAVKKPDGRVHACLDTKELNDAIHCEQYPLPTIEEIATHLHGTKFFSVLNAQNGFSIGTLCLTRNLLFLPVSILPLQDTTGGVYMPFGISSAPELF